MLHRTKAITPSPCFPALPRSSVLDHDPFQRIDRRGVGRLMEIAVELGRKVKPELKIGICGEHGGDPSSIELNFISDFKCNTLFYLNFDFI
ncbi:putative PEP-binding protein [Alkaliphilus metalliredigens]|uniref:putative PEP-binding protein n=1 Tax=Alkaliphilus metalliredigens TaxID=208226 RepID=UPI00005CAAD7|nr:putative PEP-binding protein [Alkaliphilus metalliredigens]